MTPAYAQETKPVTVRATDAQGPIALYKKSYALVIGIGDYGGGGWPKLDNAIPDAVQVAAALTAQGFEVRLERNLALDKLENAFREFFIVAGQDEDARLLVWFAGHGYTIARSGGQPASGYIVAAGAPNPASVPADQKRAAEAEFRRHSLSMSRFSEYMKEATSKHVLMLFDSCFSGTVFSALRAAPSPAITRATGLPARQFITSGTASQTVRDDGTFQRMFVNAIAGKEPGADANNDGYVTASELGVFLGQKLSNLTRNRQTPVFGYLSEPGFDRGDFVFVSREPELPTAERLSSARSAVEDEAVWRFVRDWNALSGIERYLQQYPASPYKQVAEAQIELLKNPQITIASAPPNATDPTIKSTTDAARGFTVTKVLFATNRNVDKTTMGTEASPRLTFGTANIAVPNSHKVGVIERSLTLAFLGTILEKADPKRHFTTMQNSFLPADDFAQEVVKAAAKPDGDILVYVHSWNTSFEQASFAAAQLSHDLQFAGATMLFSWPSRAAFSAYVADQEAALSSIAPLNELLVRTRQAVGPKAKIHLVADGMGAKPMLEALRRIAADQPGSGAKFGEFIALAPDADARNFESLCEVVKPVTRGVTVYSRAGDRALAVSRKILMGARAGEITADGPAVAACADVIDATETSPDGVSASSRLTSGDAEVLADIRRLIETGVRPPSQRSASIVSVRATGANRAQYWKIRK